MIQESRVYAGIGSRETPSAILKIMHQIGESLSSKGWTLRSGGALGADMAFEMGCGRYGAKEIFLAKDATPESMDLAGKFHPRWDYLADYIRKLHGRNAMIVLGKDLKSPVDCVICWTPRAQIVGGTGQSLRIAKEHKIKIYNLYHQEIVNDLLEKLK